MLYLGLSVLMRLFSSSSASASERTTVVSMRTILLTMWPMRVSQDIAIVHFGNLRQHTDNQSVGIGGGGRAQIQCVREDSRE